jgi:hypothetical protein
LEKTAQQKETNWKLFAARAQDLPQKSDAAIWETRIGTK